MDDKKIAIIIHTTNNEAFAETIKSLGQLSVPKGYFLNIYKVDMPQKYAGYNSIINQIDAKYKLYLNENIAIQQQNFLSTILKIFKSNKSIGIIGCSGANKLSTHGVSLGSTKRCGKIFIGRGKVLSDWGNVDKNYVEVDVIDDWFIATQYDIAWREDLNSFGEAAQCVEFRRKGYKSVVAEQNHPFIWYRADNFMIDEPSRFRFLNDYSADLFPLVSIIMPTFNRPEWFKIALDSALNQTYRHFEIFISDDSTNNDTENLIQPYLEKYPFIKYVHHKNFTANDNWNFARKYNNPKAEFVNWLLDDDMFYPRKLEIMVEIFRNNPDVSLVTSVRNTIDENGNITGRMMMPRPDILNNDIKLDGEKAGRLIFELGKNYIGEPTTALIRKSALRDNDLCWTAEEEGFFALIDISTWLQCLTQGSLYYIANEPLSAFRQHKGQATNWAGSGAAFEVSWAKLFKTSWDKKAFIKSEDEIRNRILNWIYSASLRLLQVPPESYNDENVITLEKTISAMAEALHNGYNINLPERKYQSSSADGNNIFS